MILPLQASLPASAGDSHVVRCGDLVADLARELGKPVEVPRTLAEHRTYVERKGASALVILRGVARSLDATLVPWGPGYELRRTAEDLRAVQARCVAQRTRWLEERLKELDVYTKGFGALRNDTIIGVFKADADARNELMHGMRVSLSANTAGALLPASTLLRGLVRRIGVASLARIASGETRVYEDAPVRSALPLPPCDDLRAAYVAQGERLVAGDVGAAIAKEYARTGSSVLFKGLPGEPARATRLRLQCDAIENGFYVVLEAYDATGRRLDQAHFLANPTGGELVSGGGVFIRRTKAQGDDPSVAFSESAQRMAQESRKPPKALPAWFLDPVAHEPLDFSVREAVAALVRDESLPVVYDVADAMSGDVGQCVADGRLHTNALRAVLAQWLPSERLQEGGVVVWRTMDPVIAERRRADRAALRRFAQAFARRRQEDLRTTARLFHDVSQEPGSYAGLWLYVARASSPDASRLTNGGNLSERGYMILGAIPDGFWDRLVGGEAVPAGTLGVTKELRRLYVQEPSLPPQGDRPAPEVFDHPMELYPADDLGATPISLRPNRSPWFTSGRTRVPNSTSGTRWTP